jgi:putative transposase
MLNRLKFTRGVPRTINLDNGPEFVSKALEKWAYDSGVILDCVKIDLFHDKP